MTNSEEMNGKIHIVNVLGCKVAEIPLFPAQPLVVVGPNAAGKSSVAIAAAAVLAHQSNPLGVSSASRSYLRETADFGEVAWFGSDEQEYVRWVLSEKGIRVASIAPEPLHPASVGLIDFVARSSARARSDLWESIFLPSSENLIEQVIAELKPHVKSDRVLGDVIALLREQGWDHVEQIYRRKATEMKREWSLHAGRPYGKRIAMSWDPEGWKPELTGLTVLDAEAAVNDARQVLQAHQISEAVSALEAEKAKKAALELPALKETYFVAQKKLEAVREEAEKTEAAMNSIRLLGKTAQRQLEEWTLAKPEPLQGVPCPHCGNELYVTSNRRLQRSETKEDFARRMKDWEKKVEEMDSKLVSLRAQLRAAKLRGEPILRAREIAENNLAEANAAYRSCKKNSMKADKPVSEEERLDARVAIAEQQIEDRKKDLELVKIRVKASQAHQNVMEYTEIADVFGPRGVRARAMAVGMERIKEHLTEVQRTTGWPSVKLDTTYAVTVNDRPAVVSATSEQWRAQIALQIAVALSLENPLVIVDGADVLVDAFGHNEMSRLILLCDWLAGEKGVATIVCASGEQTPFPEKWPYVAIRGGKSVDL